MTKDISVAAYYWKTATDMIAFSHMLAAGFSERAAKYFL